MKHCYSNRCTKSCLSSELKSFFFISVNRCNDVICTPSERAHWTRALAVISAFGSPERDQGLNGRVDWIMCCSFHMDASDAAAVFCHQNIQCTVSAETGLREFIIALWVPLISTQMLRSLTTLFLKLALWLKQIYCNGNIMQMSTMTLEKRSANCSPKS